MVHPLTLPAPDPSLGPTMADSDPVSLYQKPGTMKFRGWRGFQEGFFREFAPGQIVANMFEMDFDSKLAEARWNDAYGRESDPNYDFMTDPRMPDVPEAWLERLYDAKSYSDATIIISALEKAAARQRYIEDAGLTSGLGMGIGILMSEGPAAIGGLSMAKLATTITVNEIILSKGQPERTFEESVANIVLGTAITGAALGLGRGISALSNVKTVEAYRFGKKLNDEIDAQGTGRPPPDDGPGGGGREFDPKRDPDPKTGRQAPFVERATEDFNNMNVDADALGLAYMFKKSNEVAKKFGREAADIYETRFRQLLGKEKEPPVDAPFDPRGSDMKTDASSTVFRGSGGEGKVKFDESGFGEGEFFAFNKKTAANFGKDVEKRTVSLKKPFIVKSDAGLLDEMRVRGIDTDELIRLKNEVIEFAELAKSIRKKSETVPREKQLEAMRREVPRTPDGKIDFKENLRTGTQEFDWMTALGRLEEADNAFEAALRKAFSTLSDSVRREGFDGAIFKFGQPKIIQATKGRLTKAKFIEETLTAAKRPNFLLNQQLANDQLVIFKKQKGTGRSEMRYGYGRDRKGVPKFIASMRNLDVQRADIAKQINEINESLRDGRAGGTAASETLRNLGLNAFRKIEDYLDAISTIVTEPAIRTNNAIRPDQIINDLLTKVYRAIDDTDDFLSSINSPVNFSKIRQAVTDMPEVPPVGSTLSFEQRLSSLNRVNDHASMKSAIEEMERSGSIDAKMAESIIQMSSVMPENFFRSLRIGSGINPDNLAAGTYFYFEDLLAVFGQGMARMESRGTSAGHIFAHETGHRVFFTMVRENELLDARSIFDGFHMREKTEEFLTRYPKKSTHFSEWFAEEFAHYWVQRAKTGKESAFTWLEGAYGKSALGLENTMEAIAIRADDMARRFKGLEGFELTSELLMDKFFQATSGRIAKSSMRKILDDIAILQLARAKRFDDLDDFLTLPRLEGDSEAALKAAKNTQARLKRIQEFDRDEALGPEPDRVKSVYSRLSDNHKFQKEFVPDPDGNKMLPAWFLEKIPAGPIQRILQSSDDFVRHIGSYLVEHPFYQMKNTQEGITPRGVDRNVAIEWLAPLVDAMKASDGLYKSYRQRVFNETGEGAKPQTGFGESAKQFVVDKVQGRGGAMDKTQFGEQVTQAMRRTSGKHSTDGIAPEAIQAAKIWQEKLYGPAGRAIKEHQLLSIHERRRLNALNDKLDDLMESTSARGMTVKQLRFMESLEKQIKEVEAEIKITDDFTLDPNYVNRLYNLREIAARRDEFHAILVREAGYTPAEASGKIDTILRGRSHTPLSEDATGMARSLKERQIPIDDVHIEDFLENNIYSLGRYYATRVGADIELTKQFGSIDLKEVLDDVRFRFDARIQRADNNPKTQKKLIKERDQALEDIKGIRDRHRGTYGIPDDPTTWTHRGIRVAKMFNATTLLTGALSALPDLGKLVMQDGILRTFGTALEAFKSDLGLLKLAKREANLAGEATDMYLAMRAALFADLADSLSAATPFERAAGNMTQKFFNINLMNQWNEGVKTLASLITGSRIIVESGNLLAGTISKIERTKLQNVGINKKTAQIIVDQTKKHGLEGNYVRIAKTELWDATAKIQEARRVYSAALGKDINRVIVTPGKGETPLFMSKPLATLIFQFKTFEIAATHRTLIPGLQLKDRNFITGLIALTALGAMVEAIRRSQLDMPDQKLGAWVTSAVERGGHVGVLSSLNQSLEVLSDNRFGLRPLLGAPRTGGNSGVSKVGAVLGPTVQQGANAARVLWDIGPGEGDARTADAAVRLMPLAKTFWANGVFNTIEDGITAVIE